MFGLTKREQRWKAEQKIAEVLLPTLTAEIQAAAQIRIAEANADTMRDSLTAANERIRELEADLERLVNRMTHLGCVNGALRSDSLALTAEREVTDKLVAALNHLLEDRDTWEAAVSTIEEVAALRKGQA